MKFKGLRDTLTDPFRFSLHLPFKCRQTTLHQYFLHPRTQDLHQFPKVVHKPTSEIYMIILNISSKKNKYTYGHREKRMGKGVKDYLKIQLHSVLKSFMNKF